MDLLDADSRGELCARITRSNDMLRLVNDDDDIDDMITRTFVS